MIKPHIHPRIIETIRVNGLYLADRRVKSREPTTGKPQVKPSVRKRKIYRHRDTIIDIWV